MNRVFYFTFILLLSFTFGVNNLNAEESSFTLKPGKLETEILPGQEKTIFIDITNNLGQDYDFKLSVEDVSFNEDEGIIFHQENLGPYSLKNYTSLKEDIIFIKDKETLRLAVDITLPTSTPPGSRHGVVLVSPILSSINEGEAFVSSQIGSLLFVKIPGEIVEDGKLEGFKPLDSFIFGKTKPVFSLAFNNTGNVYLNPYGVIKIKSLWGSEKIVPVDPWFVLPESLRSRDIDIERLPTGFYKVEVNLNRGYENIIDKDEFSFWVISISTLISAIVVFLVMVLSLVIVLKFKKR